jgi:hypothetical protein
MINLTTYKWDENMEEMVRLFLLGGAQTSKWATVATMLDMQVQDLSVVGLRSSANRVSTCLSLVLQQKARILLKEGMVQHCKVLRVQVITDASGSFNAT